MVNYIVELSINTVDKEYKRFVEELMEVSHIDISVVEDRKEFWNEYEIFKNKTYYIELELSNYEYIKLSKTFNIKNNNN
ncbi:hypothetical protein CF067_16605 [Clostridium sporogenes]